MCFMDTVHWTNKIVYTKLRWAQNLLRGFHFLVSQFTNFSSFVQFSSGQSDFQSYADALWWGVVSATGNDIDMIFEDNLIVESEVRLLIWNGRLAILKENKFCPRKAISNVQLCRLWILVFLEKADKKFHTFGGKLGPLR